MNDQFSSKKFHTFVCKICDYSTSRQSQYERHQLTTKHKKETESLPMDDKIVPLGGFVCECGKEYKHRQGLWKHAKSCEQKKSSNTPVTESSETDIKILTNLIMEMMKKQNDFTNTMVDFIKTSQQQQVVPITHVNSHNMTTTNNNTFNLSVFLNEKCKDAMNINEFVDSIQLDLTDLESVGKLGFIEGISNIIVRNLKALDVTERPIHCPDKKREIIYIKDENKWEKEDDDKKKLKKAIKRVAYKNEKLLPQYKQKYPDYNDSESKRSDQYSKIVIEALGGQGGCNPEKEEKILKKITKEVVIDKAHFSAA
jgi:hypothetical protein